MSPRIDHEKARRHDVGRAARHASLARGSGVRQAARQETLSKYVQRHSLACFKCSTSDGPWAKTGVSKRGPWALCQACASKPKLQPE